MTSSSQIISSAMSVFKPIPLLQIQYIFNVFILFGRQKERKMERENDIRDLVPLNYTPKPAKLSTTVRLNPGSQKPIHVFHVVNRDPNAAFQMHTNIWLGPNLNS